MKIKNKKSETVLFNLNDAQKKIRDIVRATEEAGKLSRFIILKARQEGVSTYFEAEIFHRTSYTHNIKSQIIGHLADSANNMFAMFNRFYDNLPEWLQPIKEFSNEKKIGYKKLKSEILIGSAEGGSKVKRSDTIQLLHCTETAYWRDAKETMLALLQTVPDEKNTLIAIESTANGVGGWFYDTWKAAVNDENGYVPIFLAWFDLPDYQLPFDNDYQKEMFIESLTEIEVELKQKFKLSLEQLNWRRYTIKNKCDNDLDKFKQEYPSTAEEAFIVSGRPVFNTDICFKKMLNVKEPKFIGDLVYTYDDKQNITGVEFIENKRGFIKIWYNLKLSNKEKNRFVAGADVAEGLEQGDFSNCSVLDRKTNETCLDWHGHIDPDLFAEEIHKIYLYLNKDLFVNVESNNHGLTTVIMLFKLQVNQYYRQDFSTGWEVDKGALGTKTTIQTKPLMIDDLSGYIREDLFEDNDKDFWGECLTFVKNDRGQMQAQGKDKDPATKCFDDRVMTRALMIKCHKWLPQFMRMKEEEIIARPFLKKQQSQFRKSKF